MRVQYERQLQNLQNKLTEMGGLIEYAVSSAIKALSGQSKELAKQVIKIDEQIDQMEQEIQSICLKLLLMEQPMAGDLRFVTAAAKMITDMERIGDQAADISEIVVLLSDTHYIKELEHIPMMADEAIKMVNWSIEAFIKKDELLAKSVIEYDDKVDDLFVKVREELKELIKKDVDNSEQAFDLIMIAKYLERIGDHAVNIAEWVIFSLTGKYKYDTL